MTTTHIRVPVEVKKKLDAMSRKEESVGSLILRLIEHYEKTDGVNTSVNSFPTLVNDDVNYKLTDLNQRILVLETGLKKNSDYIEVLDEKIQILLIQTKYQMQVTHNPKESQSIISPEESESEYGVEVELNNVNGEEHEKVKIYPNEDIVSNNVNAQESRSEDDWIIVTDDIRSQLISSIATLQKVGMSYEKMGKLIGMGKGRFSEIHQGKMKKIHQAQYEALMNAPSHIQQIFDQE